MIHCRLCRLAPAGGASGIFGSRSAGCLFEVCDQVVPVLGLLETSEGHLGARNVLLGVLEVLKLCQASISDFSLYQVTAFSSYQSILLPFDTLLLVCVGV